MAGYLRRNVALGAIVVLLVVMPFFATSYFTHAVMTRVLMLGIAAASLVFLHAYGGMTSLAQWLMSGVAGFMVGNAVGEAGSKGLQLGWNPWVAVVFALAVVLVVSLMLGALASRAKGIYFLMLTLVYAVIGYYFFGQVTVFSGFGGITGITPPDLVADPTRLYYVVLVLAVVTYVGFKALTRTPFGLALQGTRDDDVRMSSLGFNVPLHRTMAFTLAGCVAGVAGILNIWWRGQIDPNSIAIGPTLDILIIAVIGGISYLEGAWLGALVFVTANLYMRNLPFAAQIGLPPERFNTVVGVLVLLIMVLSPEGLAGLIDRGRARMKRSPGDPPPPEPTIETAGATR